MGNEKAFSPIILLGYQRSGTTALSFSLSKAFSENGGIFTINGKLMYYLKRWLNKEDLYYRHLRVDEILYSIKRKMPYGEGIEEWCNSLETVLREAAIEVADGKYKDTISLSRSIINKCYRNFYRWGDKYNEYLHDISYLEKTIPNAKYILLYRNPYEVAMSVSEWKGDRPWRPSNREKNLEKWATWHNEIIPLLKTSSPNRYIVINYSNLCSGNATAKLSDFVELELKPYLQNLKTVREPIYKYDFPPVVNQVWKDLVNLENQLITTN
ncbi:sulfotransferase [Priestia megaterium]|nr:sulfotransferase [Priestia megaterium]